MMEIYDQILCGDCVEVLQTLPSDSVDLVLTSPPYFQQREYGDGKGIGNETAAEEYISVIVSVFQECVRLIKPTGAVVFNLGDKYLNGNLALIPYRFAIEAQKVKAVKLINELKWVKTNPVPKPVPRKLIPATEPFFIFVKSNEHVFNRDSFLDCNVKGSSKIQNGGNAIGKKYHELIDQSALSTTQKQQAHRELCNVVAEVHAGTLFSFRMKIKGIHALPYGGQAGGRLTQLETKGFTIIKMYGNTVKRDVIESTVESINGNKHPAVYPEFIVQEVIKLLTNENAVVLDPFLGSGTTAVVAKRLNRKYIGIEIQQEYVENAKQRLDAVQHSQALLS